MNWNIKELLRINLPFIHGNIAILYWFLRLHCRLLQPTNFKKIRIVSNLEKKSDADTLFFATRQNPEHLSWMFIIEKTLNIRGHSAVFIGCDKALKKTCNSGHFPMLPNYICNFCYIYAKKFHETSKSKVYWLNSFIDKNVIEVATLEVNGIPPSDLESYCYSGYKIGEIVKTSVIHFMRSTIDNFCVEPVLTIFRNYLINAICIVHVCQKILETFPVKRVLMMNGLFMPEQIMFHMAKQQGIKVITYENGFLPGTLSLFHNKVVDYNFDDTWETNFKNHELNQTENKILDELIFERENGKSFLLNYWKNDSNDVKLIYDKLGLSDYTKIAVAFTNITWDSTIWAENIGFSGMLQWLEKLIDMYNNNPEKKLVIRVHPGERVLPLARKDSVVDLLNKKYSKLPKNISIVSPESNINSYKLMEIADIGFVYYSTTGLEMAVRGKPVVVAGGVPYRGKGFTIDVNSELEFYEILKKYFNGQIVIDSEKTSELARRYMYFLFYKVSIPLSYLCYESGKYPKILISNIDNFKPGTNYYLDMISDSILDDKPFFIDSVNANSQ